MAGLCTGSGYHYDGFLNLEVRGSDDEKILVPLKVGGTIALALDGQRRCVGYRAPDSETLTPCPHEAVGTTSAQCSDCLAAAQILPCLRCTGERCNNPARRKECVQDDNHGVYLASFGPGVVKVGVARWHRRRERLVEQGARAAIIISRDDGQQVRRTEKQFLRNGIPDRYSESVKLEAWSRSSPTGLLVAELRDVYLKNKPRVMARWMPEIEVVELPHLPLLSASVGLLKPHADMRVRGRVVAVMGSTVVVDTDANERSALEVSSLAGWPVRDLEDHELGQAQLAFAIA